MKRHPALIPLSHDHHRGLVEARRLRQAAAGGDAERREAATAFLEFFARDTIPHFREEEERIFPLVADTPESATELVTQALLEHQQLHALAGTLADESAGGDVRPGTIGRLAQTLEAHIRFEERTLFPLIEAAVPEGTLLRAQEAYVAGGTGPLWGTETDDLNATLLAWPRGSGPAEHVNGERDVLLVVLAGSATVTIDGEAQLVEPGEVVVIEKGSARRITAGPDGVRYLTVHTRRGPLQISRALRRNEDQPSASD